MSACFAFRDIAVTRARPFRAVIAAVGVLLASLPAHARAQDADPKGLSSRHVLLVRLTDIGADVTGPTLVTGNKQRTVVLLSGFNPLNPTTYQITVSGTPLVTTDAATYAWVATLLKLPALTTPPAKEAPKAADPPKQPPTPPATPPKKNGANTLMDAKLNFPPSAPPPACTMTDLRAAYATLRNGVLASRDQVASGIDVLNRLRQQIVDATAPRLATRASVETSITTLEQSAASVTATLMVARESLAREEPVLAATLVQAATGEQAARASAACNTAQRDTMALQTARFLGLQQDAATVRAAFRAASNAAATASAGLLQWRIRYLDRADASAFTAVATLNTPSTPTTTTITIQRVTAAAPTAPTPLVMPPLTSEPTAKDAPGNVASAKADLAKEPPAKEAPAKEGTASTPAVVATITLVQDVRPTITVSVGGLITPSARGYGYVAPTYATTAIGADSVRLTETTRGGQARMTPVALAQFRLRDSWAFAFGGTLLKGTGTAALTVEPFAGGSFWPTDRFPYLYVSVGVLGYRGAKVRDDPTLALNTTVAKAKAPEQLYQQVNRTALALAVTWRIR